MVTIKPDIENLDPTEWDVVDERNGDALHKPTGEIYRVGTETISKMVRRPQVVLKPKPVMKAEL